jgi:predicted transcriptional regulator
MAAKNITREAIKKIMQENPGILQSEIAERLNLGRATVNRHVQDIRNEWRSGDVK